MDEIEYSSLDAFSNACTFVDAEEDIKSKGRVLSKIS